MYFEEHKMQVYCSLFINVVHKSFLSLVEHLIKINLDVYI
jgi:hypothetical protein